VKLEEYESINIEDNTENEMKVDDDEGEN